MITVWLVFTFFGEVIRVDQMPTLNACVVAAQRLEQHFDETWRPLPDGKGRIVDRDDIALACYWGTRPSINVRLDEPGVRT